jgi:hypothetical protein
VSESRSAWFWGLGLPLFALFLIIDKFPEMLGQLKFLTLR